MGINKIVGELMGIDLIRVSYLSHRERERERGNALSNELVYSSMMSNVELQLCIYRRLTLM